MSDPAITFIVGVGRSGSSIFNEVLVTHPLVSWPSILSSRWPDRPGYNRALMRGLDVPLLGRVLGRYFEAHECYPMWNHGFPGFATPCRDLTAEDVTASVRQRLRRLLHAQVAPGRPHLVAKITGWSRLSFLNAIFPDARFIQILRDGRAVTSSMLKVDWWTGWHGPPAWGWGALTPAQQEAWEQSGRSFIALAAIQWQILMTAAERAKPELDPARYLELRYEDVCADPVGCYRRAVEFAGLPWVPRFERSVRRTAFRNENTKWQRDFTPDQQALVNRLLGDDLRRYGYLVEA
ncbi:MAG TPA: sulfotransferase [Gemmatimonadales bacterium]|nr:sulfotransferase [Gemmatimonadales bacterium]